MSVYTSLPQVVIEINNTPLSNEIVQTIFQIQVKQFLSVPSQCEIKLAGANQDFVEQIFNTIGEPLKISIIGQNKTLFLGQITAVEVFYDGSFGSSIMIRSYDQLHRLRKQQTVRTHVHVNLHQLATELTQCIGVNVQGGETTPTIPKLFQFYQNDLELLQQFGEKFGFYFFLEGTNFQIVPLTGKKSELTLTLGQNLLEARFSVNAEAIKHSVTATGWNLYQATHHSGTASSSELASRGKIHLDSSDFSDSDHHILVDCVIEDDLQAEQLAQKELDARIMQQITLSGSAEGNTELTPGLNVQVVGGPKTLCGSYTLTETIHRLDPARGFITEISTSLSNIESKPLGYNAAIGIVSQVDDPDEMGRVKVSLPTFNDIETDWLEVLVPGAGNNKGQLILPDIDDQVLLLFVNGEPTQSVVLGGLYGNKNLPQSPVADGVTKRFITQTSGNQKICLDDENTSILIETNHGHRICITPDEIGIFRDQGSFISLTSEHMTIHSDTNLDIEAPGHSITIRGKRIDFEEA